jgi:hypothetical protein
MTSQAYKDAVEQLIDTPSREAGEIQSQFPRVNRYARAEHSAFIDGALYANDWLLDVWRKLEFDHEPTLAIEATKELLIDLINMIGEQSRIEADCRFPLFDPPTEAEIKAGKFVPVSQ